MLKAVIFDYGKVVAWAENRNTTEEVMTAFRVTREEVAEGMKENIGDLRTGKVSEEEFWRRMAVKFNKSVPSDWKELWRKGFREKLFIDEEMLKLVRKIKNKGIKTATVTNNIAPFVEIIRERQGFDDFDEVIISCEVGMAKPDKGIYQLAIERLKVKPREILMVDDREENIKTAKDLGMKTLLALDKDEVKKKLARLADTDGV